MYDDTRSYPIVQPPFFGNMLFSRAAYPSSQPSEAATTTSQGGAPRFAKVVGAAADESCNGFLKLWPLVHDSGELRVMAINKNEAKDCQVVLFLTETYSAASIQRLMTEITDPNAGPLSQKVRMEASSIDHTEILQCLLAASNIMHMNLGGCL